MSNNVTNQLEITLGYFVLQQSGDYAPFLAAWFQEKFDAEKWVAMNKWEDMGVGDEPFTFYIVPNQQGAQ